jgi:hypothetical protein
MRLMGGDDKVFSGLALRFVMGKSAGNNARQGKAMYKCASSHQAAVSIKYKPPLTNKAGFEFQRILSSMGLYII